MDLRLFAPRWLPLVALVTFELAVVTCIPLAIEQPTKEVNLGFDLLVKNKSLQEDIDQFFRDQEHLLPDQNKTRPPSGWMTSLPTNFGELVGDIISLNQLSQIMSQLGIPITIDPASIAIMIFKTPMDWASGLSSFRGVNATRPIVMSIETVVQKS